MGNVVAAEAPAGVDEVAELYELNTSETAREGMPHGPEPEAEPGGMPHGPEPGAEPEGMPHG